MSKTYRLKAARWIGTRFHSAGSEISGAEAKYIMADEFYIDQAPPAPAESANDERAEAGRGKRRPNRILPPDLEGPDGLGAHKTVD